MGEIATAAVIMAGLGLVFAIILATANHCLRVDEDPRLDDVEGLLPGTNCGACGTPGCRAFAERLLAKDRQPAGCTVASPEQIETVAEYLGVAAGESEKVVARLKCAGSEGSVGTLASYAGVSTCRAAVLVNGGGRACEWGCLHLGDCATACTFGAIHMGASSFHSRGLPIVDIDKCTACNDCVVVCPLDLFVLMPIDQKLFVQCSTPLEGEEARSRCEVACDACGRCAADSPPGVIEMKNGLPHINYPSLAGAGTGSRLPLAQPSKEATFRCPTGSIVWLEGPQFAETTAGLEGGSRA